jgi:hypothetical protein
MIQKTLSMPELVLIAGTRVALGVGIGLLVAGRLDRGVRLGAGCALATVGALTTIPLVLGVIGRGERTNARHDGRARAGEERYAGSETA